jgi:hypothetical protein
MPRRAAGDARSCSGSYADHAAALRRVDDAALIRLLGGGTNGQAAAGSGS